MSGPGAQRNERPQRSRPTHNAGPRHAAADSEPQKRRHPYDCDVPDHWPVLELLSAESKERRRQRSPKRRLLRWTIRLVAATLAFYGVVYIHDAVQQGMASSATQPFAVKQSAALPTPSDTLGAWQLPMYPTDSQLVGYYMDTEAIVAHMAWQAFFGEHGIEPPPLRVATLPAGASINAECRANGKDITFTGEDARSVYCQRKLEDGKTARMLTLPTVMLAKVWDAKALGVKPAHDVRLAMVSLVGLQYGHYVQAVLAEHGKWEPPQGGDHRDLMACFAGNWTAAALSANPTNALILPNANDLQGAYSTMAMFGSDEGLPADYERGFTVGFQEPRPGNCVREFWPNAQTR